MAATKLATAYNWRFQALLVLLLSFYAIAPFFETRLVSDVMSSVVLTVAVSTVIERKGLLIILGLLAASAITAIWYARWSPTMEVLVAANVLDLLLLAAVVIVLLSHVFRSRQISRETIAAAICAYLLFGAMWGDAFAVLENLVPGSFSGVTMVSATGEEIASRRTQLSQFGYFSFVTLSTLGYGDITPLTRAARNLAALEALCGQLYLAVLVAQLVSQRHKTPPPDEA